MSETLAFDPDSVYAAQKALFDAVIQMSENVERPLRRIDYPEMPAGVRAVVSGVVADVIGQISQGRSTVGHIAQAIKNKSYDLVEHDDPSRLGWGWRAGDAVIGFTGLDLGYKIVHHDEYGWGSVGMSALSFASNFVPVGKIAKVIGRGGKLAVGTVRGTRAAHDAQVAAQLERAASAGGMRVVRPPASSFEAGRGGTHLHSGRAWDEAADAAGHYGGSTIEMTSAGGRLTRAQLERIYGKERAAAVWDKASLTFARRANGVVRATVGKNVSEVSTFVRVELPELLRNARVPSLTVNRAGSVASRADRVITVSRSDPHAVEMILASIRGGGSLRVVFKP